MIFSDEYLIEKPYLPENCRLLPGAGSVQGLERLRKVLKLEKERLTPKSDARQIEGKMMGGVVGGKENRAVGLGVGGAGPRKGG
jgi:hypothetical protein